MVDGEHEYVGFDETLVISRRAMGWMRRAYEETGRSVEDLAELAIEEVALEYAKSRGWL